MTAERPALDEEQGSSRAAGGCVLAVGLAAAGSIVYAVPESAYFVAGLLATRAVGKVRTLAARFQRADEEPEGPAVDVVAVLQGLAEGGEHVRLTQLQKAARLPDTKTVRALLGEAGIRIRDGVRAAGKNGPGVHHDDVPPIPTPVADAPSEGCLCSSAANTNTNNTASNEPRKGTRVEAIGQAGALVHVESERREYKT